MLPCAVGGGLSARLLASALVVMEAVRQERADVKVAAYSALGQNEDGLPVDPKTW